MTTPAERTLAAEAGHPWDENQRVSASGRHYCHECRVAAGGTRHA